MAFVCNLREALNFYGWKYIEQEFPVKMKEIKEKITNSINMLDKEESETQIICNLPEYCKVNNAEFIPDLSSQFVSEFLPT